MAGPRPDWRTLVFAKLVRKLAEPVVWRRIVEVESANLFHFSNFSSILTRAVRHEVHEIRSGRCSASIGFWGIADLFLFRDKVSFPLPESFGKRSLAVCFEMPSGDSRESGKRRRGCG